MAANKFATILHRNSNKITLVLVYTFLEWVLIFLLLLHALFSYLILKFADWFGLSRPCFWCSRLDHVFEPGKALSHTDLLCQAHAMEVSNLGFCSNHRKLTETRDLCEDCSPDKEVGLRLCSCCGETLKKNRLFSPCILVKPTWGDLDFASQNGNLIFEAEIDAQSEYIDVAGNRGISIVSGVKSSSCSVLEEEEDDNVEMGAETNGGFVELGEDLSSCDQKTVHVGCEEEDESVETVPHHLEFYIDQGDDRRLIPVDLMDFSASETDNNNNIQTLVQDEEKEQEDCGNEDVVLDFSSHFDVKVEEQEEQKEEEEQEAEVSIDANKDELEALLVETRETDSDLHQDLHEWNDELEVEISIGTDIPDHEPIDEIQTQNDLPSESDPDVQEYPSLSSSLEVDNMQDFNEAEKFEETEKSKEEVEFKIVAVEMSSQPLDDHKPSSSELNENEEEDKVPDTPTSMDSLHHQLHKKLLLLDRKESGADKSLDGSVVSMTEGGDGVLTIERFEEADEAKEEVEFKILSVETGAQPLDDNKLSSSEFNENEEEDKVPDTPTSMDSLHQLHKKLLLLDRKESGAEESLDGSSIVSETEGGDGVLTIEKLKSALRTERKVLNALYSELEEERSASAIAANQTMAMINRLQEEKASMQMEALQYQRMMEEQSEYDQEALQLLNELVVKREKEKQELEKEIEVYRRKLQDYEAKDKIALLRNRKEGSIRSRNSSVSCSNADDSDGLSIDLSTEVKKDEVFFSRQEMNNQSTPAEAVIYLEETLTYFEEERLSILEELKMLEEKLFTLSDEEQQFEDIEHYCELNENGYHKNSDYVTERNGFENGYHVKEMNGKHYPEKRTMSTKAKTLLPLFDDVADADVEDNATNGEEQAFDSVSMQKSLDNKFDTEFRRVAVEEEVDHVYERLQALEADREFLKHCIGSLRKGDKGLELLQEILQHLRDLRSVDHQLKNMVDGVLA